MQTIISFLHSTMTVPQPFGVFHIIALILTFVGVTVCWCIRKKHSEKQLKLVLALYAIPTLILEILKQISWSATISDTGIIWDYQWYAFPFQLCTTPLIVCLISLFLKKNIVRDALLSYVSFIKILGSLAVMILPSDCFVPDILVNVHTTYLHFGSFIVSCYLLFSGEIKIKIDAFIKAVCIFISFAMMANVLNVIIYNSGVLMGETFNMFYISPYFISSLPVFNQIQQEVPYVVFLMLYLIILSCGSLIIYGLSYSTKCLLEYIGKYKRIKRSNY